MNVNPDYVPSTIEEAARHLYLQVPLAVVDKIKHEKPRVCEIRGLNGEVKEFQINPLSGCFMTGVGFRNMWSLWEDTPLRRHAMENYGIKHADDLWGMIIEWAWHMIQDKPFDTAAYSGRVADHWKQHGLNNFGEPA